MEAFAQTVITFIEQNQAWLPFIMIVFAAAETTAFLSILIPSTPIMVAIGAMASAGEVSFWPIWVGASIGAMMGSFFSFWLGVRYGPRMLAMRPLSDSPETVEKARALFAKYGPVSIIIGHFTTIFRPIVFLLAGMSGMALWRFAAWNILGCWAWAYIVPKVGQVGGDIFGWLWSQLY
jgi:membrane protein DedA with SNARE-associated domain